VKYQPCSYSHDLLDRDGITLCERSTPQSSTNARPRRSKLFRHLPLLRHGEAATRPPIEHHGLPVGEVLARSGRSRRVFGARNFGGSDCVPERAARKPGQSRRTRGSYLEVSNCVVTDGSRLRAGEGIGLPKHAVPGMSFTLSQNRPGTFAGTSR
jgi:hypothetical protein